METTSKAARRVGVAIFALSITSGLSGCLPLILGEAVGVVSGVAAGGVTKSPEGAVVIGGAGGAGAGALVGAAVGGPIVGAIAGGVTGGTAGYLTRDQLSRRD